jgi:hypothetical protein
MTTFNIEEYLDSLPEDIKKLDLLSKGLTYIPSLERFKNLQELDCSDNQLTSLPSLPSSLQKLYCIVNHLLTLPPLPSSLQELYCSYNLLSFDDILSWRTFDKFRKTYYQLKYGPKLERYFLNVMKKKKQQLNNELLYSPHLKFYKQFADPITLETMKN